MDRVDILDASMRLKEANEFTRSDFWKVYQEMLINKLRSRAKDCISLDGEKLYRAQGEAQALQWVINDAPTQVMREMGKKAAKSSLAPKIS